MKKVKIDGLLALNVEEIQIVYMRCRGDSVQKVANEMGLGASTIWNERMPPIFRLLEVKDWKELEEALCDDLRRTIPSVEALKQGWPEEFREKVEALRERAEPAAVTQPISTTPIEPPGQSQPERVPSSSASASPGPTPARPISGRPGGARSGTVPPPWFYIAIPIVFLCLLCIGGMVFARPILENILQTDTPGAPTTQSVAPADTEEPQLTNTPPFVASETSQPTATSPASPSATSPSPTTTQTAPETSPPQPPALFETDFESGFPLGMEYVRENVDIVNGELIAHDYTLLGFGDGTWKNYQVEYEARKHTYCWGLQNNGVAAHAIDPENMIMWSWNYCETGWFEIVNGDWNAITSGRDVIANPGTIVKIRLVAENGNFSLFVNNNKNSSYFNEKYTQGKAYILVTDSSVIDNIRIRPLP
jgi:hypothetical protein